MVKENETCKNPLWVDVILSIAEDKEKVKSKKNAFREVLKNVSSG